MAQGIVMFSGGLDSVMTTHLLRGQGLDIKALHFVLPFYSGLDLEHRAIKNYASALGVPLRIEEEGGDFLDMVKDPKFGYGKNANPCLDCRIYRLKKAKKIMEEEGASFIATGEVIGQRPMSQRLDCMLMIEKRSGLKGRLLRPLCAQQLQPTIAEQEGIVKRELLLSIGGRSRAIQLAYAKLHSLQHAAPAGGCVLTNEQTAKRFLELSSIQPDYDIIDFKLLAYGRHFRLSPNCKAIISREDSENDLLQMVAMRNNLCEMELDGIPGPIGIIKGEPTTEQIEKVAAMLCRFSKVRDNNNASVIVKYQNQISSIKVSPATDSECQKYRI